MIVIRDIDWVKVDRDFYEQVSFERPLIRIEDKGGEYLQHIETVSELIVGRQYVNQRGERVVIGKTKLAQEILGLEYEVWDNTRKENEDLKKDMKILKTVNAELKGEIYGIKNATFLYKLKFLFGI